MTEQDLPRLADLVRGHRQIWLVYSHHTYTDPQGLIPDALAEHARLVERRHFLRIDVYRYQR